MTDKQIDINNQVEVGLNIAKELLELHKMFKDEVEKSPYFIQTNFIKNKLFYFYQRANWLNVCFNLLDKQLKVKQQECEELKEDYATAKSMYDLCQSNFMELAKIKDEYKQTLIEIKEIMKKHCKKCKKHKFYHFQLCCTCKYTDILQKSAKVEDE